MLAVDRLTRLSDVTFCVLDLETTGTSDEVDEIVEVGAVIVRGGEQLGTFQTMVRHPLVGEPCERPRAGAVLASLLELVRGAVIVGHNIHFDLRFLNAALWRAGHPDLLDPAEAVDTMPLARRLLREDAGDCRLGTLAERFGFEHRPTHRALADALATVELLHLIIERATHYGASDLDDLLRLPALLRHRHRDRLARTAQVPRGPGAACLRGRDDEMLHVVVDTDLRHGVRRLFDIDDPDRPFGGVPAAVLQRLREVTVVATEHQVVARLAALRWQTTGVRRGAAPLYLQVIPGHTVRWKAVADASQPGIVAGPIDRATARATMALLRGRPDRVHRLLDALGGADEEPGSRPQADDDDQLLASLVDRQRRLDAVRARCQPIEVDGATLILDDGRVVDVVIGASSWSDRLPQIEATAGDTRGRPMTAAHAAEAEFVAGYLAQGQRTGG